jgi:hypothetical protein
MLMMFLKCYEMYNCYKYLFIYVVEMVTIIYSNTKIKKIVKMEFFLENLQFFAKLISYFCDNLKINIMYT